MKKKIVKVSGLVLLAGMVFTGCGKDQKQQPKKEKQEKITVLSTGFAGYDFAKAIGKDKVSAELLLPPGVDCHGYEPAPKDIKRIENADIFVYTGGESENWIKEILKTTDRKDKENVSLIDASELIGEEGSDHEGHDHEDHDHEAHDDHDHEAHDDHDHEAHDDHDHEGHDDHDHEGHEHEGHNHADEHVWLSIDNAENIAKAIGEALEETDEKNKDFYEKNTDEYVAELEKLKNDYENAFKEKKRDTIAVGDRFPFKYLLEPWGIKYKSAIPGCAGEAEPNAKRVAELMDFIKENDVPVVFHTEMGESRVCDSISESTGAKSETLYSLHNISPEEHKKGKTYLEFMRHNLKVLKEALN